MKALNILSRFSHESERILIPFVLAVYAFSHPLMIVIAVPVCVLLYRYDKVLFVVLIMCLVVHAVMRLDLASLETSNEHIGTVLEVRELEYAVSATVKTEDGRFQVSGFDTPPLIGERYAFKGDVEKPFPSLFRGGFDYGEYLKSQNISGIIRTDAYERIDEPYSIHVFRRDVRTYFEERDEDSAFLMRTFILADNRALDSEFKDKASVLGVSHLFAVSGMHVAFMAGMLYFLLKKVGDAWADFGVGLFLVFYIFLTGAPPSVLRAATMAVCLIVVKRLKLPFSALDILSLLCIGILMVRPYSLHDMGFVLSFMVSFTLLMGKDALHGKKRSVQTFNVSLMAFLVTVPIVLSIQNQLNVMSIFYNALLVWFLMLAILPLVYLTAVFPVLSPLLLTVYGVFEGVIVFMHDYGMVIVRGHMPPGVIRIIYWGMFAWVIAGYSHFSRMLMRTGLFIGFILLVMFAPLLNPTNRLTMFAVDGDAFLVEAPFSSCNILIDTGGASTSDALVSALHRKHIRRLDYVVITHYHADHYGGYEDVAKDFRLEHVVTPSNVEAFHGHTIHCGTIRFYIYPKERVFSGKNDGSIVLWMDRGPSSILFTGDIEEAREESIVKTYDALLKADMLKVPHHGSNTSSTKGFLEAVQADEALVSAHPNNRFGHPGQEAIERMREYGMTVYRTDQYGSVEFIEIFGRRVKKTAIEQ